MSKKRTSNGFFKEAEKCPIIDNGKTGTKWIQMSLRPKETKNSFEKRCRLSGATYYQERPGLKKKLKKNLKPNNSAPVACPKRTISAKNRAILRAMRRRVKPSTKVNQLAKNLCKCRLTNNNNGSGNNNNGSWNNNNGSGNNNNGSGNNNKGSGNNNKGSGNNNKGSWNNNKGSGNNNNGSWNNNNGSWNNNKGSGNNNNVSMANKGNETNNNRSQNNNKSGNNTK